MTAVPVAQTTVTTEEAAQTTATTEEVAVAAMTEITMTEEEEQMTEIMIEIGESSE